MMKRTWGSRPLTAILLTTTAFVTDAGMTATPTVSEGSEPKSSSDHGQVWIRLSGHSMQTGRLSAGSRGGASGPADDFTLALLAGPSCRISHASGAESLDDLREELDWEPAVSWWVEGHLISMEGDTATVNLHWTRDVAQPGLSPGDSVVHHATLRLREGETAPLDLVTVEAEVVDDCWRYVAELDFEVIDPPEVADAKLDYDLWLVHNEPGGGRSTERMRTGGNQRVKVAYQFASMRYATDGTPVHGEGDDALLMDVLGEIRGRARPDGLIDLTVEAERWIWRDLRDGGHGGTGGGSGVKHLTVQSGETIEIVLPRVGGTFGERYDDGAIVEVLDLSQVFAGHTTSIRVTANRVR